jgi:hypothetical protein
VAALRLELLGAEHLPLLGVLLQDPAVQRFTRIPVPVPEGFERTWLDLYEEARRTGTREGLMRSVYLKPGIREDTELWSRLPSDSGPA